MADKDKIEILEKENARLQDVVKGTITAVGYRYTFYDDSGACGGYNINYSSILTRLIQEAGRWCKNYASDLFITWSLIADAINEATIENNTYIFAFRQDGVDNKAFYKNCEKYYDYYRAVWELTIKVDEEKIEMILKNVR